MNTASYVAIWLPIMFMLIANAQRKKAARHRIAAKMHREKGGEHIMEHIAHKYLGRGVSVTTVSETHVGILTSYNEGWITLTYKGKEIEINGDYVVKVQPHNLPREKHVID